jgi:hypothetical protein
MLYECAEEMVPRFAPKFVVGDLVRFKRCATPMPPAVVDGFVEDAMGKLWAALSRNGKGCGCVPVGRLVKVEVPQ